MAAQETMMAAQETIAHLMAKAKRLPSLAHVYGLEIDRLLCAAGRDPITFSASGVTDISASTLARLGLNQQANTQTAPNRENAIYQAEQLAKEGQRTEALAYAFSRAQGAQINDLNLFYANHTTQTPALRRHYLNKYLAAYELGIDLDPDEKLPFFYRIKSATAVSKVDGPLVTVIMPAYNAQSTIELAINSLIDQSWHNLQIIIVNDASTDGTLQKAKELARQDQRIKVLSNTVNVGPYVSRNLGVRHARGRWLTVHDADDWAFPHRIEQQVKAMVSENKISSLCKMLRMNINGEVTRLSNNQAGYKKECFVSLMIKSDFFKEKLGAWDSVKVGADGEMISRLEKMGKICSINQVLLLCLDHEKGLTNQVELGLNSKNGNMNPIRAKYKKSFQAWHSENGEKKLTLLSKERLFTAPKEIQIKTEDILKNIANQN